MGLAIGYPDIPSLFLGWHMLAQLLLVALSLLVPPASTPMWLLLLISVGLPGLMLAFQCTPKLDFVCTREYGPLVQNSLALTGVHPVLSIQPPGCALRERPLRDPAAAAPWVWHPLQRCRAPLVEMRAAGSS